MENRDSFVGCRKRFIVSQTHFEVLFTTAGAFGLAKARPLTAFQPKTIDRTRRDSPTALERS